MPRNKRTMTPRSASRWTVWYNWCRCHTTTRTTPAQAAGLTDTWYDAEWLAGVVEAHLPKPARPKPRSV